MKRQLLAGLLVMFSFALGASAQTVAKSDTFTFATGAAISRYTTPPSCGAITAWDGVPNAYPEEMGQVCVGGGYGASLEVPFHLGYLNNGSLASCDPMTWGPRTYTVGDGTHNGDQFTQPGATICPYYTGEYGTDENSNNRLEGFSVVANYTVVRWTVFYRGRAYNYVNYILTGGIGTVTDSVIN